MPSREHDASSIVSVRIPDELLHRLDRIIDDRLVHTGKAFSRNAAVREALENWVIEQEELHFRPEKWLEQFRTAYQTIGKGRDFVRIHRIREALDWPRERFDRVLEQLRASYTIELHEGDPRQMKPHEIEDSYQIHGILYITLSWHD